MLDPIILRARQLAAQSMTDKGMSPEHIRRASEGWYDTGFYVTEHIARATAEALRNREEAEGE